MKYIKSYKIYEGYHGSIGAGVVPFCRTTKCFLLGFRSTKEAPYDVKEPGTWGGFGGKLDIDEGVDESIQTAALRELEEETSYYGDIRLIKGYVFTDINFEYHNFIGVVDHEFEFDLNWENDDARWFTYEEMLALKPKHFGLIEFLDKSRDIFERLVKN